MSFLMKKEEIVNPSSISRVDVWVKSHTHKNGEPVNAHVAEIVVSAFDLF